MSGYRLRLPTEAEWEKAARGAVGRRWPWSDEDWDPERANVERTIGTTTAVGIYPLGATPEGVHDLAGNVWEWTHSLYRDYPYDPKDGREDEDDSGRRVLRGGSWFDHFSYARCAYRDRFHPDDFGHVGLRVEVAPALAQQ
jgi:formylglycine-generating enzyme required for sulfatase activity